MAVTVEMEVRDPEGIQIHKEYQYLRHMKHPPTQQTPVSHYQLHPPKNSHPPFPGWGKFPQSPQNLEGLVILLNIIISGSIVIFCILEFLSIY